MCACVWARPCSPVCVCVCACKHMFVQVHVCTCLFTPRRHMGACALPWTHLTTASRLVLSMVLPLRLVLTVAASSKVSKSFLKLELPFVAGTLLTPMPRACKHGTGHTPLKPKHNRGIHLCPKGGLGDARAMRISSSSQDGHLVWV